MTAQDFIDYIMVNHYEDYELTIEINGEYLPVTDAWGIGGQIKITAAEEKE